MNNRLYPKRLILGGGGGGGTLGPLDVTFNQDPTASLGGNFSPVAQNQNGWIQIRHDKAGAGTDNYWNCADVLVLAPNQTWGSYDLTTNRALQVNFDDNHTAVQGVGHNSQVSCHVAGLQLNGVGTPVAGFRVALYREINNTGVTEGWLTYDQAGVALNTGVLGTPALGAASTIGVYLQVNGGGGDKIGLTYNGVDQGFLPVFGGGADQTWTFPAVCSFLLGRYITGNGVDANDGLQISGAMEFNEPLITESGTIPAGYNDFNGNAL